MSKVTAIVSAYYAADFLEDRLENLMTQEPQPDIIVVCQHNSAEHHLARSFKNIDMLTTGDVPTIYKAWNLSISIAQTEYIINANTDDAFYPGALDMMAQALDKNPEIGLVFTDIDRLNEDGEKRYWKRYDATRTLIDACYIGPMPMWRRSLHDLHGYFDEDMKVAGDYEFWLRLEAEGVEFGYIDRAVGCYRVRADSLEHRNRGACRTETAEARRRYLGEAGRGVTWLV